MLKQGAKSVTALGRWLRRKRTSPVVTVRPSWDLETPLLQLSPVDCWTIRDACENTLVLGGTGSGKTSGSGGTKADAYLRAGFGGLVCTSKAEEVQLWLKRCARLGRADDVILVEPGGKWKFNPLDFEMRRKSKGAGQTENVLGQVENILEIADRGSPGSAKHESDPFWRITRTQCVRNAIAILGAAEHPISFEAIYRIFASAPQSRDEAQSASWRKQSFLFRICEQAMAKQRDALAQREFELAVDLWLVEFASLASRTRSIVVSSFTSQIDMFQRGILYDLFGTETTFTPEACEHGRIIIVGLPVKEFREIGRAANVVMKYCFQRAIEARDVLVNPRCCFQWLDEFQNLATSHDAQFLSTSRAARAPTVLLTQNVSGVYAALGGGDKGRAEADAIFANCNTKIMHSNSCHLTNEWAANVIGKRLQTMHSGNTQHAPVDPTWGMLGLDSMGRQQVSSSGFSESYQFDCQPRVFTRLRTGGPANDFCVDGIWVQSGRIFRASDKAWLRVTFKQNA